MNALTIDFSPTHHQATLVPSQPVPNSSDINPASHSSVLNVSPDVCCVDNDINDLLRDNFGNIPGHVNFKDKFFEDLDQNLPLLTEIFDDLQSAVKNEDNSAVKKELKVKDESEKTKIHTTPSLIDIQKEIEHEMELERVEKLRNPKFQTMPAYEKRAKQEVQWRAAIRAARQAQSLHTAPYPVFKSGDVSNNLHTVVVPVLTKDPVDTSNSLDLTSLDLLVTNSSASKTTAKLYPPSWQASSNPLPHHLNANESHPVPIVRSTQMKTTKKYLSAANHFPANSRIFNRSLQQLQSQADAISSSYLSAAARNYSLPSSSHNDSHLSTFQPRSGPGNALKKTANITRFLKDVNRNSVIGSTLSTASSSVSTSTKPMVQKASSFLADNNFIPILQSPCYGDPANNNNSVVVKSNHLPVYSIPHHPVRSPQVLNPNQIYRVVGIPNASNSVIQKNTSVVHPQPKLPLCPRPAPKARLTKKSVPKLPTSSSCHNCQKLSRVLPYLAHGRRKLVMSSTRVFDAAMVLLCEVCGAVVRETVIFGSHMVLDHVSTAHFPLFLVNRPEHGLGIEENQNYMGLDEDENEAGSMSC